jgi:hypothetical protein
MLKEEIEDYYEGTGWNAQDLMKELDRRCENGIDRSFDGSLAVYHFPDLVAIVSSSGVGYALPFKN